jgi:flagellar biosynthesis/type III secretory pathway protein FliH
MRLSANDARQGRVLSAIRAIESSAEIEQTNSHNHAQAVAAEFARARAEGYAAGMDDANAELEARKAELEDELSRLREQLLAEHRRDREELQTALLSLTDGLETASHRIGPVAVELAFELLTKVVGRRADEGLLWQDLLQSAVASAQSRALSLRVGEGFSNAEAPDGLQLVVDTELAAFECVVEIKRGGLSFDPAQSLRELVDPLLSLLGNVEASRAS